MTQRHTCAAGFKGANPFKLFCERKEIWTIDSVVFAKKTMIFSLRFGQLILRIHKSSPCVMITHWDGIGIENRCGEDV